MGPSVSKENLADVLVTAQTIAREERISKGADPREEVLRIAEVLLQSFDITRKPTVPPPDGGEATQS